MHGLGMAVSLKGQGRVAHWLTVGKDKCYRRGVVLEKGNIDIRPFDLDS